MNYPMTLEQYIVQMPMREVDLVRMGAQIADALAAIHQQGSVHGNVKPGNILITAPGTYQLIGMESVRQYPEGTIPVAVAPELEQGGTYQAGTDVYALGMMMKSLIPRQGVSGVLDEILRKACEPDPARRYTTALEFAEELQTLADLMQDTVAAAPQAVYEQPNPQSYQQPYTQPVSHAQQPNPQPYEQPYTQPAPHAQQSNPQPYEQPYTQPVPHAQRPTELVNNRHPQETDSYRTRPQEEMHLQPKKEKDTKQRQKKQKESLALHFLLPILLVLIIGAAVAVYVILIRPSNEPEATTEPVTTTEAASETTTEIITTEATTEATTEEAECPYEYSQKVTVTAHAGSTSGTLTVYNWENGDWTEKFSCGCKLGKNGIGSDYGEGKGVTPMGTFKLGFVMANVNPDNGMDFKLASSTLGIVDDAESELYNTLVDTSQAGDVSVDRIGNNIVSGKLKAIIFIEHNGDGSSPEGVTPGKGSVITICGNYSYEEISETAGCIDIDVDDMTTLLSMLDGSLNPYIEITLN